ncbi:enoyl-CoA hydratase/isomerase family protein [Gordonia sp. NPDC058843]|uniref:enoyl-CoA hydratase/isomerase family protein n=1 Tax=Gordonia sp. NPDC058843 TaxID=3346648 RepID=UPI0036BBFC4E
MSASPALTIVDLDDPVTPPNEHDSFGGVIVAITTSGSMHHGSVADRWAQRASFTITDHDTDDRRLIRVDSIDDTLARVRATVSANPVAAQICEDVLRTTLPGTGIRPGLTTESLAYSTLQAGPEFARWLAGKGRCAFHEQDDAVLLDRLGNVLTITFNRPDRHNAFSNALRAGLIDGLNVALTDESITSIVFTGNGRSFCSGGDLVEFGLLNDPADAHLARTRHSPALLLDAVRVRLGAALEAHVHGAVLGSGLEMAAYCGTVIARSDAVFGLPELRLGLIPGAGGTVSIPRRIGRWRTSYLAMSGLRVGAETALSWGLIDDVVEPGRSASC